MDLGVTGFRYPDVRGNPSSRKVVLVLVLIVYMTAVFWALPGALQSHGALPVFGVPSHFMNSSHPCLAVACLRSVLRMLMVGRENLSYPTFLRCLMAAAFTTSSRPASPGANHACHLLIFVCLHIEFLHICDKTIGREAGEML